MVRIVGDDNLSDAERIAEIRASTGASEARAEQMLEQSRGGPRSDLVLMAETAPVGHVVVQGFESATPATSGRQPVLTQG